MDGGAVPSGSRMDDDNNASDSGRRKTAELSRGSGKQLRCRKPSARIIFTVPPCYGN